MSAAGKLYALAERCETAAEGKQSGLLWEAGGLVHGTDEPTDSHSSHAWFVHYAQAEAWLDAAITLVPEGLCWRLGVNGNPKAKLLGGSAASILGDDFGRDITKAGAATPALALCAAALRARAALTTQAEQSTRGEA